jgi:hypothetical protein
VGGGSVGPERDRLPDSQEAIDYLTLMRTEVLEFADNPPMPACAAESKSTSRTSSASLPRLRAAPVDRNGAAGTDLATTGRVRPGSPVDRRRGHGPAAP